MEGSDKRQCKYCKSELYGRIDKVFCSTPCRNAWHNEERQHRERHIRRINGILRTNWRILTKLNSNDKTRIRAIRLEAMGFEFGYHTSLLKTKAGKTYYYCYDQGYLKLNDTMYLLVRNQPNG